MKTESVTSDANWMTRRSFLRAIGATALASVVTSIPLSFAPSLIPSVASSAGDEQDVHKALEIATASSVFSQAIEELSKLGFEFVPGKSDFCNSQKHNAKSTRFTVVYISQMRPANSFGDSPGMARPWCGRSL